ncbi:MAG: PilZ domain-containing protein [Desulfobacteraceae bacterium]|nr:PilZ domain-containing protein [Desulfobacteraceae bacterium]
MEQQINIINSEKKNIDEVEVTSRLLNIIFDMPVEQQLKLLNKLDTTGYNGSRRQHRKQLKNPWIVLIDPKKERNSHEHFITNISRCGMFIETNRAFLDGEKITMRFQVPSSQKIYKIVGEIVRSQENGIGVKFKRQLSER